VQISLDRQAQEALFDLPSSDGDYSREQLSFLGALGAQKPAIVMAFPPKAAGTFLRSAAVAATGGDVMRLVYAQGSRDAQLYLPTLIGYYLGGLGHGPLVAHIHMQAFPPNVALLEALGIRPVIMLRSIADMLASYWDMLERSTAPNQGINCTIPPDFRTMDSVRKADFMVDVIAPWYAGYYGTWLDYAARAGDRVCILDYSSLRTDPAGTLKRLLDHAGTPHSLADCQKAIEDVWPDRFNLRFNEGLEGRSHQYFSISRLERIGKLLSYYPSTTMMRADLIGL
jgi:sulfotransferase family protein